MIIGHLIEKRKNGGVVRHPIRSIPYYGITLSGVITSNGSARVVAEAIVCRCDGVSNECGTVWLYEGPEAVQGTAPLEQRLAQVFIDIYRKHVDGGDHG